MNNKIAELAEESINIELNVSEIYFLFHTLFTDDSTFWSELALEEQHHATLIRSGIELFEPVGAFPHKMLSCDLPLLKETNVKLNSIFEQLKKINPSREEAFNTALDIENSAGELHFQNFQSKTSLSSFEKTFRQLNENDKDHAERILAYMKENNIPEQAHQ